MIGAGLAGAEPVGAELVGPLLAEPSPEQKQLAEFALAARMTQSLFHTKCKTRPRSSAYFHNSNKT